MDAKEYINSAMLRDTRIFSKNEEFWLSPRTYNGLYNGLLKYIVLLDHEKENWLEKSTDKLSSYYYNQLIPDYNIREKKFAEKVNTIMSSKENLCRFLVEENIPLRFVPHIWYIAIKEIENMLRDFYKI